MIIVGNGNCGVNFFLSFNKEHFTKKKLLKYIDGMSRTDFLIDHLEYGSFVKDDLKQIFNFNVLRGKSDYKYILKQITRTSLKVKKPDIILLDNWGDMNFTAWKCKKTNRRIWICNQEKREDYLNNYKQFIEDFDKCGYLSYEQSIENYKKLIKHYRRNNPNCPVIFINIYTQLWKKDYHRNFYEKIPYDLQKIIPNFFIGYVDKNKLKTHNGKPGLHFTKENYQEMFNNLKEQGFNYNLLNK